MRLRAVVALDALSAFVQTYFTDERGKRLELSAGQIFACDRIEQGLTEGPGAAVEMARGHGKSLLMKAAVLLSFLRSYYQPSRWHSRYASLLTSGSLYKQFSRDLGNLVVGTGAPLVLDADERPLLQQDFWLRPAYDYPDRKRKEPQLWNQADKLVYVGSWEHPCRLSVRGMTGGRGDVRGLTDGVQRPDLLVVDDPMKESEAENDEITEAIKTFIKRSYIPCGGPNARQLFFGTPFNARDLITELCGNARSKPLTAEWPGFARCALPAVHPTSKALLCPQLWSPDALEQRRAVIGTRAYYQEYLLDPQGGGLKHFEAEWLQRWTLPAPTDRKRLRCQLYCDPSLGRNTRSDESAIVILDREQAGAQARYWVRQADLQRRRPQKLVTDYLDLWERYRPELHGIEDEGFQELLLIPFQQEIAARKLPDSAMPQLLSTGGVPKVTRIKRLSPLAEFGGLRWADDGDHRALRRQAENWGGTANEADDGLDALEGCTRLEPRSARMGNLALLNP